jgi:[NiFe] hydrogenase diaphorase moiety small subunit
MSDGRHFTVDGRTVPFHEGQTVMRAALEAGVYIPHLCYKPGFHPRGSCRLCTVKVNGQCVAACTTLAQDGMAVASETPEVVDIRRALVEMLFVEGNHTCPACEKSGACRLQAIAYHVGLVTPRFEHLYPARDLDASHPDVLLDRNRCILCQLCIQASRDVDGKNVFAIGGRGIGARIVVNAPSGRLGDTTLSVQDAAVGVCPVGAILLKRHAYEVPIGRRTYDRQPISEVAIAEARAVWEQGHG